MSQNFPFVILRQESVSWLSLVNFYEITHAVVWSCHVSFPTMLNEIRTSCSNFG